MSLTYVPLPFVKDDPKVQQRSMLTILGRGHRNPTCSRLRRSPDCPNCLVNCVDQAPWQASACPTKLTKELDIPGPNCISFWGLRNYIIPWFISILEIPIEPRTDKDPWSRKASQPLSQPLDVMAKRTMPTWHPLPTEEGCQWCQCLQTPYWYSVYQSPAVDFYRNPYILLESTPCCWLLQTSFGLSWYIILSIPCAAVDFTNTLLVFCFINPLRLIFANTPWVTLYIIRINPCCWLLQTPFGSYHILFLSTPYGWFLSEPFGPLVLHWCNRHLCN